MSAHCEKCGQAKYLPHLIRGLEDENALLREQLTTLERKIARAQAARVDIEQAIEDWRQADQS